MHQKHNVESKNPDQKSILLYDSIDKFKYWIKLMYGLKNCVNNQLWIVDFNTERAEGFSWVMVTFCILP